jgi:hypothetical protein
MIRLENVLEEWKTDSIIDKILIDESALKIACIHQKYLVFLNDFKRQKRLLKRKKSEFPVTDKRGNPEYIQLEELLAESDDGIESCEKIIYAINQMSFTINSIVKWRAFLKGSDEL